MFLLSLTRKSIARHIDAHEVREFLRDGWVVTVATDGWLSSYTERDGEVAVAESPLFSDPAARDALPFTRAAFTQSPPSVELRKELIGGRPVYYHAGSAGDFYCSTHVRELAAAGVRLEEDVERLPELFIYRYVSAPRTLFKGIHQLLSGQRLRFEHDGLAWRPAASEAFAPPRRQPDAGAPRGGGLSVHGDHTLDALREAMRALARDRDRVQLLLSGGLDSSVLFKLAQSELGVNDSYSTGYPFELETNDVEKRYALTAAEAMGARHRFFVSTTERFLRGFVETVSAAEEPVAHLQAVLLLLLFRDGLPTGRGIVVNGEGADGLYGLQLHRQMYSVDRFAAAHPWVARALRPLGSPPLLPVVSSRVVVGATRAALRRLRRATDVLNIIGARWGPGVAASDPRHVLWRMGAVGDTAWVRGRFRCGARAPFAERMTMIEAFAEHSAYDQLSMLSFLASASMSQRVWSKLGEAAGKVIYYPFAARSVMEAAFEAPWDVKLREPKGLLRDAARKAGVPGFVISRPKANFNATPAQWSAPGAALEPLVPLAAKAFDEKEIRRRQTADWADAHQFATMLNYAIWKRLFIHGDRLGVLLEELERSSRDTPVLA